MSENIDKDWIKRILTCDIETVKELYTKDELVNYEQEIENEININV